MYLHFGHHYFGKVDSIPGLCHVATRFFHINFVPLIPLESSIILAVTDKGGNPKTVKTALSFKSILVAWLRAALYVVLFATIVFSVAATGHCFLDGPRKTNVLGLAAAWGMTAAAAVVIWLTYRLTRASYDRTLRLGEELGLPPEQIEELLTPREQVAPEPEGWERYK